ncbi:hypothetical protein BGY98DRAFT_1040762 [Russula aff. rugulosa BPL654]|nr:hypothetical protein BGY98DRAFT_1040762 [Russula aff. rugulosa BPL654]
MRMHRISPRSAIPCLTLRRPRWPPARSTGPVRAPGAPNPTTLPYRIPTSPAGPRRC